MDHRVILLFSEFEFIFSLINIFCWKDGNGLELWFGNLAWSLGRKLGCIPPGFSRHQFYKLSYKLLSLTSEKALTNDQML
jgi:hypothetical protein